MATKVLMPKLGLTMTEGTIEEWKFKEGDSVKKGDILFSVATDKLTNDVECDTDGVLLKILCGEGETMTCKSILKSPAMLLSRKTKNRRKRYRNLLRPRKSTLQENMFLRLRAQRKEQKKRE